MTLMIFRTTNEDGRYPGLISREAFTPGMYKLRFETGSYWETLGQTSFYPYVEVSVSVQDAVLIRIRISQYVLNNSTDVHCFWAH